MWLAEDARLKRKVAIKLLPSEFTSSGDRLRRFEQEAQAASALNHPNIVSIYDIGEDEAGKFIVMEYVSGQNLRSLISKRLTAGQLSDLALQVSKGLNAAHTAGITHRDIKPENVMIRDDGFIKLVDFGLARLLPTSASGEEFSTLAQQTLPGTVMGTVAYMSPEQARGVAPGPPSDIFALGVVLYELAAGTHPFKSENYLEHLQVLASPSPKPLRDLRDDLPEQFTSLIHQMLDLAPTVRPSASKLVERIQTSLPTDGTLATVISSQVYPTLVERSVKSFKEDGFWIAVLPFRSRGNSAEVESLAEGISEDIVTGLSRFTYLRVIARSSTLGYANYTGDLRAAGKDLGASYVLEGSIRQSGSQLRVAVQLVDTVTGANLWANSYDLKFSEDKIFEIQDELVPRIVSTLADQHGILSRTIRDTLRGKPLHQLSPYESVLLSFSYAEKATLDSLTGSLELLEAAVGKSPSYADAWAGIAGFYAQDFGQGFMLYENPLVHGLKAAQRAIEADASNYLAWYSLAQVAFFQKDFLTFKNAAEKSIGLNPLDAICTAFLGQMYLCSGNLERGIELAQKARYEPESSRVVLVHRLLLSLQPGSV